jgi:hypothetical protein
MPCRLAERGRGGSGRGDGWVETGDRNFFPLTKFQLWSHVSHPWYEKYFKTRLGYSSGGEVLRTGWEGHWIFLDT